MNDQNVHPIEPKKTVDMISLKEAKAILASGKIETMPRFIRDGNRVFDVLDPSDSREIKSLLNGRTPGAFGTVHNFTKPQKSKEDRSKERRSQRIARRRQRG